MKKCPTCDKTFNDGMRFCQIDGTLLVEIADASNNDPFKTKIGNYDDLISAVPPDPFKTMVAPPPKKEEQEILELPEEPDFLKTIVTSPPPDIKSEPLAVKKSDVNDSPPSPYNDSAFLDNPKADNKFTPYGGEKPMADDSLPKNDSAFTPDEQSSSIQSPYENQPNHPIPSPFEESMFGYQAPIKPNPIDEPMPVRDINPFDQPIPPLKEAEIKAEAFNTPYAAEVAQQHNQPLEQSNWTPPPVPDANWQNQQIGQNTPFQPPQIGVGENKTLAIVSLVLGILSIPCCGFILFGIGAVVTGFMAKGKADQNPNEYGGRSLALGGIIIGAITIVIGIILNIINLVIGIPMSF